jgi:hypothetical protein
MKERCDFLKSLVGEYQCLPTIPPLLWGIGIKKLIVKDGTTCVTGGMSVSKWLAKAGIDNKTVSLIAGASQPYSFSISCRFKDIENSSDSPHFTSCYATNGAHRDSVRQILKDPNVAVYFRLDQAGKFQSRGWLRAGKIDGKDAVLVYRAYGNGLTDKDVAIKLNGFLIGLHDSKSVEFVYDPITYYEDCNLVSYKGKYRVKSPD